MKFEDIDPDATYWTPQQRKLLRSLFEKKEQYTLQARGGEAHGVRQSIVIAAIVFLDFDDLADLTAYGVLE